MWSFLRTLVARRRLRRSIVVVVLLLSQTMTATGVAFRTFGTPSGKDTSRPFPCMNRPCGCMTAEECWRGCCCFTMAEKLAWAREHDVPPPDSGEDVFAPDPETEESCPHETDSTDSGTTCPHCKPLPNCDASPDCSHCKKKSKKPSVPASTGKVIWVVGMFAARCQGHGPLSVLSTDIGLPPTPPFDLVVHFNWIETLPTPQEYRLVVSHQPVTPPPRSS